MAVGVSVLAAETKYSTRSAIGWPVHCERSAVVGAEPGAPEEPIDHRLGQRRRWRRRRRGRRGRNRRAGDERGRRDEQDPRAPAVAITVDCADRVAIRGARLHAVIVEARCTRVGQMSPVPQYLVMRPRSVVVRAPPGDADQRRGHRQGVQAFGRAQRRHGHTRASVPVLEQLASRKTRHRPSLYPQSPTRSLKHQRRRLAREIDKRSSCRTGLPGRCGRAIIVMRWR